MDHEISFDFKNVADTVRLPVDRVKATVALLDEGNAIPFITRFRKDQTGGLNESQIRNLKSAVSLQRGLIERKQTIIKSIDSQQKLTEELVNEIKAATNHKSLEDIYLPFRPKRQTLAATARQQGLEPLARELLEKHESENDLASRALEYVRVDKGITSVEQVYDGVGHLVAEHFGDHVELRKKLRELLWNSGKLTCRKIESENDTPNETQNPSPKETAEKKTQQSMSAEGESESAPLKPVSTNDAQSEPPGTAIPDSDAQDSDAQDSTQTPSVTEQPTTEQLIPEQSATDQPVTDQPVTEQPVTEQPVTDQPVTDQPVTEQPVTEQPVTEQPTTGQPVTEQPVTEQPAKKSPANESNAPPTAAPVKKSRKKKKKKKPGNKAEDIFKDFFDFSAPIRSLPPHRTLAINRGERAKTLRVRIEVDNDEIQKVAREALVDPDHPQVDFMHRCVDDALNRLIIPSLEREIRRELTDAAEKHALKVFAKNLRNLLLQPPLRRHRVLAIDPGYQSGCHFAALDEFGHTLATGVVHVVGNAERRRGEEAALAAVIRKQEITAIGIGNGAASREAEKMIAKLLKGDLKDVSVAYAMINEAGASAYSTSVVGREELPDHDAVFRSAISIGRRMLDPLSELVKISPENLGIGMYQHDVKAKHLQEQLAEVVESCVNFVGVDVNTASPALLKYVAGLNQLTARRVFEYRQEHGPFLNREQFKSIPGFGDVTFVQSAGFLKIFDGDQPLDATPIHPESYPVAQQILKRVEIDPAELVSTSKALMKSRVPLVSNHHGQNAHHQTNGDAKQEPKGEGEVEGKKSESKDQGEVTAVENPVVDNPAVENTSSEDRSASLPAAPETTAETTAESSETTTAESSETTAAESSETTTTTDTQAPQTDTTTSSEPDQPSVADQSLDGVSADNQQKAAEETDAAGSTQTKHEQPFRDTEKLEQMSRWRDKIRAIDSEKLASELNIGGLTLRDILSTITRPTRDPRESLPKPIFRREIVKLEDLEAGMLIRGRVVNVVDFGVFVDIGLGESSLVHVSQLSRRFVNDPHEVAVIGDLMKLWVTQIDKSRRRITLTAINPSPKPAKKKPQRESSRKPRPDARKKSNVSSSRDAKPKQTRPRKPPKPPKPVKPITDAMKKGVEPMRSFSDLTQFFKDDKKKKD